MTHGNNYTMKRHPSCVVLFMCAVGLLTPSAVVAQEHETPTTSGFAVGGHVTVATAGAGTTTVNGQPITPARASGLGGGLVVSYGLTDRLTVYLNGDGRESANDLHLSHADLGLQYFFSSGRRLRPHVDLAFAGLRAEFASESETLDARGSAWSFGGGALYFLHPRLALDATILQTAGGLDQFRNGDHVRGAGEVDVNSTRFNIGVRWYPGK